MLGGNLESSHFNITIMQSDFFYNLNKVLTDEQILDKYESLALVSIEKQNSNLPEIKALSKLIDERGLSINDRIKQRSAERAKVNESKNSATDTNYLNLDDLHKQGLIYILIGLPIFLLGCAFTIGSDGRFIFFGAIITGGLFIAAGVYRLYFVHQNRK